MKIEFLNMSTGEREVITSIEDHPSLYNNSLVFKRDDGRGFGGQHLCLPISTVIYYKEEKLKVKKLLDSGYILADNGITVFGSYVRTGKYLDDIGGNEAKALKMANDGYSTKDLPETENRGFGISTSKSMLVDGLNGAFFMLSGGAFHRHDNNVNVFVKLPEYINWNGTIILMRIPVTVPTNFNYLKYVR